MTETLPEQTETWDAPERDSEATYPEYPDNPHNHVYTVSMDGRGPMIVVRGNTPAQVTERFQALMDGGVTTVAAAVYSHMKAEMAVANGLGPVSPVAAPQGPPAPPAMGAQRLQHSQACADRATEDYAIDIYLMNQSGMTIEEIADVLGETKSTIGRWKVRGEQA